MPSLRSLSGRQVRAILAANGFVFVSQRGSHMKMQIAREDEEGVPGTRTVIVPDHGTIQLGTLISIIRQSGLDRALFEA